jgi:nucleoside-diphosphate-sugar epimerase
LLGDIICQDLKEIEKVVKADSFTGKKVLVTGGAGFIGSWLCDALVGFGCEVTAVDDLSTGRMKNVDHLLGKKGFEIIQTDVCNFKSKEKYNIILHMAGHASPDEYQQHPIETLKISAQGTEKMAELAS